jgi:hypothetical protein
MTARNFHIFNGAIRPLSAKLPQQIHWSRRMATRDQLILDEYLMGSTFPFS